MIKSLLGGYMLNKNLSLQEIIRDIQPIDENFVQKAKEHTAQLVMPNRALGRLHDISERLCGIQKNMHPSVAQKAVLVFAGDHGVVAEGVSAFPQTVSMQMVNCFLQGGAGINALSRHVGAEVYVIDMGLVSEIDSKSIKGKENFWIQKIGNGTASFAQGPAMSLKQAEQSIIAGFEVASYLIDQGVQILGTGDMGIGNTTPSAAIGVVMTGKDSDQMVGKGTGIDEKGILRKQKIIDKGLKINQPNLENGLEVLSKVGGFEIGGIAGCILAGAYHGVPVVVDGFISTSGLLIANSMCPKVLDYIFAGHVSEEPGHKIMLDTLGLRPILDLGMRLGEGTGAVLAMDIIEAGTKVFNEVFTFEQAQVSA